MRRVSHIAVIKTGRCVAGAILAILVLVIAASAHAKETGALLLQDARERIRQRLGVRDFGLCVVNLPETELPEYLAVAVEHNGVTEVMHLYKLSVRGPNFNVVVQESGGRMTRIEPGPVRTYQGFLESEPESTVGAVLAADGLRAHIFPAHRQGWRVEPLEKSEVSGLLDAPVGKGHRLHAVLDDEDVEQPAILFDHPPLPPSKHGEPELATFTSFNSFSSAVPLGMASATAQTAATAGSVGSFAPYGCDVMRAEIGFDVDYVFYSSTGGSNPGTVLTLHEQLVNNDINTRFIRDTLIEHVIGKVIIRTDPATDPYANTPDMGVQLTTLRNIWNALPPAENTHDLAQLTTGQTTNYGGLAWVTVVCSSYRYSVATRAFGADFWAGASRHEIAHNWGLGHGHRGCPEREVGIMCGDSSRMHVLEVDTVIAHRNSRTCLVNIGPYPLPVAPYAGMDKVYVVNGSSPVVIDVLANDHDANCDVLTIDSFNTLSELGGTIARSVGTGPDGRDQLVYTPPANDFGVDWFSYTISDQTGLKSAGNIKVIVKLPETLHGYWRLDETSGSVANDSSGNGFNGALAGGLTFEAGTVAGRFGGALSFDGIDDYIEIPAIDLGSNTVTITAWIKRNGDQEDWSGIVFSRDESTVAGLNFGTENELRYHWNNDNYNWNSGLVVPDNQWTFVALVTEPDKATIYAPNARGFLQAATHWAIHNVEKFDGKIWIGRDTASGHRYFRGAIDDVRIYNHALGQGAIQAIFLGRRADNPRPFDSQTEVPQRAKLTWVGATAATDHDVYFGTSYQAVTNATTASPEYKARLADSTFQPNMNKDTEYFWRVDEVVGGSAVMGNVWRFTTGRIPGMVSREVWTGIGGSTVRDLTSLRWYPGSPNIREELTSFEGPVNWGDYYGTRIHGFLTPTQTGSYTFWIASDDNSELWLSTDSNPANVHKLAEVKDSTNSRQWNKYPEQQSAPVLLMEGQTYYIRALQKEASGEDNIAVAWEGAGLGRQVISGKYLSPYDAAAPLPNPMTWAVEPHPTGTSSISMTAATGSDPGGVEYRFVCISGGGHDSNWQISPKYEDTLLSPNTLYTYIVTARDQSPFQNTTFPSQPQSARTFLLADREPDGDVDFFDYSGLASAWLSRPGDEHWNAIFDISQPPDEVIDYKDLGVFAEHWLEKASQ